MKRYLDIEHLNRWQRFRIALQRTRDAEDDELAYAYYAANEGDVPYERRRYTQRLCAPRHRRLSLAPCRARDRDGAEGRRLEAAWPHQHAGRAHRVVGPAKARGPAGAQRRLIFSPSKKGETMNQDAKKTALRMIPTGSTC